MNVLSVKVKSATAAATLDATAAATLDATSDATTAATLDATWHRARAWGATTWDATTDVVKEFIKD